MMLGLVLTFATSWLAYQQVVWTLAVGAPDQIATLIAGTHGSATAAFAGKLDMIFQAIADSTHQQGPSEAVAAASATANGATPSGISMLSPQGMMWISGLMLLVGTVGVMVTAKVALAALLAVGPVFIIFILFPATRGLFEGWLKAVVSCAMIPLFTVLIGGATLALIAPLIRDALLQSTEIAAKSATALFLGACVYCALMAIVARTAGAIVAGWRIPFLHAEPAAAAASAMPGTTILPPLLATGSGAQPMSERVRDMLSALPAAGGGTGEAAAGSAARHRTIVHAATPSLPAPQATRSDARLQGVGSRFRTRPEHSKVRLS
jgi:type IV secretion system protein VirB6